MKNLFWVSIIFSVLFWSCNDEEQSGNENNEIQLTEDLQIEDIKTENMRDAKLDVDYVAFLTQFKEVSLPYELNPEQEDVFGKISVENQIKYLAEAEDLDKADFEEMAEYTDFFFVSRPVQSDLFNAVVYARFEMGSTYYFLCTYDNDGKLISNIDFAAYELIGAGPQAGQEYNTKGKIESDLKVTVTTDEETISYQIIKNGKIDKL
ncbi:MAG: hypothetical protein ABFS35_23090 [Bacteroidota bacterium]